MNLLQPRVIAALATLLWTAAVEGVGLRWAVGYVCIILMAAGSATVIAAVWEIALHLHDDDRKLMIGTVADVTRPPAGRSTRPLRIAHSR